jgi:DNA invertase Pin-like site-specific DNA recombinase
MRTISYARFSTDKQSESSVDDQLDICRRYAELLGWSIACEYSDLGISGAALGNRPGVIAALANVGAGDVLLVTDLSRLSRSQDLAPLLSRLRYRGVRVLGVQDGFDSDGRTARMQAGMSGIMSEEFRFMIADRVHSALEIRARDGRATGGKPFDDAALVREIFSRFAAGESLKRIASDLNRREIPSPGAAWKARSNPRGKWLVSALHAMLHNERYVGRLVWNRSKWIKDPDSGKRIRRERPESEWVIRECEPIIDRRTWDIAQSRFRTLTPHTRARRYLLSGILECGICGSKLVIAGGEQRRYRCSAHHDGGAHACSFALTFPQKIAEELILEPVMRDMLSDEAIALGVKVMREARLSAEHVPAPSNRELKELERMVALGILSPEVAQPAIEAAKSKAASLSSAAPVVAPWPSPAAWRQTVLKMREILAGDDVPAAREVIRGLIGNVRVMQGGRGYVVAQLAARSVMLATGTELSRFCGSGGRI